MNATPHQAHGWLRQLIGEWTAIHLDPKNPEAEGAPETAWTERIRPIGDIWIIGESSRPMPDGSTGATVVTIGYDTSKQQFVGTWIGSMMDMIWHYTGSLDDSGRVLTLDSEGPTMDGSGRIVKMQDIIEIVDENEHIMRGRELKEDGSWKEFMRMRYARIA